MTAWRRSSCVRWRDQGGCMDSAWRRTVHRLGSAILLLALLGGPLLALPPERPALAQGPPDAADPDVPAGAAIRAVRNRIDKLRYMTMRFDADAQRRGLPTAAQLAQAAADPLLGAPPN